MTTTTVLPSFLTLLKAPICLVFFQTTYKETEENHVTANLVPDRADLESNHKLFCVNQTCNLLVMVV